MMHWLLMTQRRICVTNLFVFSKHVDFRRVEGALIVSYLIKARVSGRLFRGNRVLACTHQEVSVGKWYTVDDLVVNNTIGSCSMICKNILTYVVESFYFHK